MLLRHAAKNGRRAPRPQEARRRLWWGAISGKEALHVVRGGSVGSDDAFPGGPQEAACGIDPCRLLRRMRSRGRHHCGGVSETRKITGSLPRDFGGFTELLRKQRLIAQAYQASLACSCATCLQSDCSSMRSAYGSGIRHTSPWARALRPHQGRTRAQVARSPPPPWRAAYYFFTTLTDGAATAACAAARLSLSAKPCAPGVELARAGSS